MHLGRLIIVGLYLGSFCAIGLNIQPTPLPTLAEQLTLTALPDDEALTNGIVVSTVPLIITPLTTRSNVNQPIEIPIIITQKTQVYRNGLIAGPELLNSGDRVTIQGKQLSPYTFEAHTILAIDSANQGNLRITLTGTVNTTDAILKTITLTLTSIDQPFSYLVGRTVTVLAPSGIAVRTPSSRIIPLTELTSGDLITAESGIDVDTQGLSLHTLAVNDPPRKKPIRSHTF